ncbi:MAG: serine protease [Chitinophagales bacterium]
MKNFLLKKLILILFLFSCITMKGKTSSFNNLSDLLQGVKYVSIDLLTLENDNSPLLKEIKLSFSKYLREIGFEYVAFSPNEKEYLSQKITTYCDLVEIDFKFRYAYNILDNMELIFHFCEGKNIQVSFSQYIRTDSFLSQSLLAIWSNSEFQRPNYNPLYRLTIPRNPIKYAEKTLQWVMKDAKMQFIEGIYQASDLKSTNIYRNVRVAIFRNHTYGFDILYLSGAPNSLDWTEGEIMGYIADKLPDDSFFAFNHVNWHFLNKKTSFEAHIVFKGQQKKQFLLSFSDSDLLLSFTKIPEAPILSCTEAFSYGSGIALTTDGYIITNQHVVESAECIQVETNDGIVYDADLILENRKEDIAILKINDQRFYSLPPLVYSFQKNQAEIGEHIFTLGYPNYSKDHAMKLRTGDITAQNGYDGNPNTYETSLNVQPGSSGGAALSSSGELIGLVKSKYTQSPNISFIIKSSVLQKIVHTFLPTIQLPNSIALKNLPLKEQIKLLKPFIFHIKSLK